MIKTASSLHSSFCFIGSEKMNLALSYIINLIILIIDVLTIAKYNKNIATFFIPIHFFIRIRG